MARAEISERAETPGLNAGVICPRCRYISPRGISGLRRMGINEIVENFSLLDDWDDRYRYLIELGRTLPPFPENARIDANKVQGCASQVWLITHIDRAGGDPALAFEGDSDAHIVRGLIALLMAIYSGHSAGEIATIDPAAVFDKIGLRDHLTPQRSNGLRSMIERIRSDAQRAAMSAA